jgi:hypothetical protein
MIVDLRRGPPPCRYIPFAIDLGGVRWSADWSVVDGLLSVGSAYGSTSRKLGRRKPERLARELLVEVLRDKLAQCEARWGA